MSNEKKMKDVLIRADKDTIRKNLKSNVPEGQFCYRKISNGTPRKTCAGMKIMFSDGDRIRGEGVILEVSDGRIQFDPLNQVSKPNPVEPPTEGYKFKYVDPGDRGKYTIEFLGVEHEFSTIKDLVESILKHREDARNSDTELKFTIWKEVQNLDLNKKEDFKQRINDRTITRVRADLQNSQRKYLPTDPEVLKERFDRAEDIRQHYSNEFSKGTVKELDEYFEVKDDVVS